MKSRPNPPDPDQWASLPVLVQLYIVSRVWWTLFALRSMRRVDLWVYPPLAFFSAFKAMSRFVPEEHPMALVTVLSTSFMAATLALFILRPAR